MSKIDPKGLRQQLKEALDERDKAMGEAMALREDCESQLVHEQIKRNNTLVEELYRFQQMLDDDEAILRGVDAVRKMLRLRIGDRHTHAQAFREALTNDPEANERTPVN